MWEIDRLIVLPNKKSQNSWEYLIFQNVLTPWVHIHHKYLQKLQVLWIRYCCTSLWCTCPKIAFFHRFWLKGHEELLSTIKLDCLETCVWQENTCAGVLQTGALQLYLNETQAQVPSCEICLVSQNSYLQFIYEKLFLLFFSGFTFSYVKSWKTVKTSNSITM